MKKLILITILLLPFIVSCTSTEQGAIGGAAGGALLGAAIGSATGGDAGTGALIGAAGGALVGTAVGSDHERRERESGGPSGTAIQMCPNGHNVDVSVFAPGNHVRCPACNAQFIVG